ncbi:maestro heat-like repeat family member 5 [Sceloporus undulatus]|uniref:maestro heat-like repeat family member 5 n=1 Tax=Sceloporus undulatus TaxID=8520 RepID=UPI001C4C46F0|nr:maestro heat-like repeat family member 5 [Sceloporus undulatus]
MHGLAAVAMQESGVPEEHLTAFIAQTQEFQDANHEAAGDILVALWDHFPAKVLTRLLDSFQERILPYHSILYVLGKLANKAFSESDMAKIDIWEQMLQKFVNERLSFVSEKTYLQTLRAEIQKEDQKRKSWDLEKLFFYQYYGFTLRASQDCNLVREHLCTILALSQSHRGPLEAKGLPWETLLLSYGQVALRSKMQVLSWANKIVSQLIIPFTSDTPDIDMKKTFLLAVQMLLEAIEATGKGHDLTLDMKSQLVECLTIVIQEEPIQKLASTVCQEAMHMVAQLSKLKPPLGKDTKSRLLCTIFQTVFALPPLDTLQDISDKALFCQTMGTVERMLQGLVMEDPGNCNLAHMLEACKKKSLFPLC